MSVAQYMGLRQLSSSVTLPGACRGTQKSSFPVLYVGPEGCDGDSQSQVPSATLHVSITLCCPFTCLSGLANVNKIVTPFPIWAHVGHPTPCAPRGRDCRDKTDKTQAWSLRKQCQSTPDSWNRIRDPGNRALEWSQTHWVDFVLNTSRLMAKHKTTQRFGAASVFGSSSLTLSRFCRAGVVSTAALEHLKVMLRRKVSKISPVGSISRRDAFITSAAKTGGNKPRLYRVLSLSVACCVCSEGCWPRAWARTCQWSFWPPGLQGGKEDKQH